MTQKIILITKQQSIINLNSKYELFQLYFMHSNQKNEKTAPSYREQLKFFKVEILLSRDVDDVNGYRYNTVGYATS